MTVKSTRRHSPEFERKIQIMQSELAVLVCVQTGEVHPDFPATVLHFWLLTESQLNSLAEFYDQRFPSNWTNCYPAPMNWKENANVSVKHRKFGKFIGLRGCESPAEETFAPLKEDLIWKRKWC